jgi:hypothetical protein
MNSFAPISITGTPGVLWKWGTILSAMISVPLQPRAPACGGRTITAGRADS